mgnify:FL=1
MTTEMWGAPYGIQQAEKGINENVLSGLKAQQLLEDIASQPLQRQVLQSHAQLYAAQARKANQEVDEASGWAEFQKQAMAQMGGGGEPVGPPGPDGTVSGIPVGGAMGGSAAAPLLQLGQLAARGGFLKQATTLLDKGTAIVQHEQAAKSSAMTTQLTQMKMQREGYEMAGSMAGSAVDQQSYDRMKMVLSSQGKDTSWMPADFESARPVLDQTVQMSLKASDQLKLQEDRLKRRSLEQRRGVQNALSSVKIEESRARTGLLTERTDALRKNGGDGSPLTQESKRATIDSKRARQAQIEAKMYPPLSEKQRTDPARRAIGQAYTVGVNPDGSPKRGTWTAGGWVPLKAMKSAAPKVIAADDEDEDDDE